MLRNSTSSQYTIRTICTQYYQQQQQLQLLLQQYYLKYEFVLYFLWFFGRGPSCLQKYVNYYDFKLLILSCRVLQHIHSHCGYKNMHLNQHHNNFYLFNQFFLFSIFIFFLFSLQYIQFNSSINQFALGQNRTLCVSISSKRLRKI